jgi:hypothetical protein
VKRHQHPLDIRPFRSKADRAREQSLETHYRSIAIPDVVAAIQQVAESPAPTPPLPSDDQMH